MAAIQKHSKNYPVVPLEAGHWYVSNPRGPDFEPGLQLLDCIVAGPFRLKRDAEMWFLANPGERSGAVVWQFGSEG